MRATDPRLATLTAELARLRNSNCQADDQLHNLLLKLTEIQLNLVNQDRMLAKLEETIHGNGKPGLVTRVDRAERVLGTLIKSAWLVGGAITAAIVRGVMDRW